MPSGHDRQNGTEYKWFSLCREQASLITQNAVLFSSGRVLRRILSTIARNDALLVRADYFQTQKVLNKMYQRNNQPPKGKRTLFVFYVIATCFQF